MLLHVVHIAACLTSLGDTTLWVPKGDPIPSVDTVHIRADRSEFATVGRKEIRIANTSNPALLTQNLQHSAQFFKEYGTSGSATISKRGADATQTQVLWNGLPINHPMLGMMDFNSISAFGMDELVLIEGGNSAMYGSGSVGGTVMMNNRIHYKSPLKVAGNVQYNTMRNAQSGVNISKGWAHSYVNLASSWLNRNNNFLFFDPVQQTHRESFNSQIEHQNIRLVAAHTYKSHQVKMISEIGRVNRGLGFLYGSELPLGSQSDLHARNLFQYDFHQKNLSFSQKIGHTSDRLVYIPNLQGGDTSRASMTFWQSEIYQQTRFGRFLFGLDYQVQTGKSRFYENSQQRILPAVFSAWKGNFSRMYYVLNARYEFHEDVLTGGFGTKTALNETVTFKTDVHRSFRRPTLNDLYWSVPLRKSLLPELGWGSEAGLVWTSQKTEKTEYQLEFTPFYRILNNPLIWLPQGAFWAVQNLYFGQYYGIQIHAHAEHSLGKQRWRIKEDFEWVRTQVKAESNDEFFQQIFVPDVMSSTTLQWESQRWSSQLNWQKVGNRYTATDNSQYLPMYHIISFDLTYKSILGKRSGAKIIDWTIGIDNALNAAYQNMPGRPMPPRNFYIKCQWLI